MTAVIPLEDIRRRLQSLPIVLAFYFSKSLEAMATTAVILLEAMRRRLQSLPSVLAF